MLAAMIADLHTHTTASDGQLSASELCAQAEAGGVDLLAITDHDTVAGIAALSAGTGSRCRLIAGIELSTVWRKIAIHVVGLNIDIGNRELHAGIQQQQESRAVRAEQIADRMSKLGFRDCLEGARRLAGDGGVARPHFAQHLVESRQVRSFQEAFKKYLGPGKPGDIKNGWPAMQCVIEWIHAAGGVAVLAHPAKYRLTNLKLEELTRDFREAGGDALEVVSGLQDSGLTRRLGKLANRHALTASCGSDFHQPGRGWAELGKAPCLPAGCTPVWENWGLTIAANSQTLSPPAGHSA